MKEIYFKYWGKASRDGNDYHLLVFHCLDVAAVGYQLLSQSPSILSHLSKLMGMDEDDFLRWMVFFLVLHDLGKFADGFQNLRSDILNLLQIRNSQRGYAKRHDTLGYILWEKELKKEFESLGIIKPCRGRRKNADQTAIDFWMRAVTGHHGQPPENINNFIMREAFEEPQDVNAATEFVEVMVELLLGKNRSFPDVDSDKVQQASWWISGFAVLCDWLGSSRSSDEYMQQPVPLSEYWEQAKVWADNVLHKNEIFPAKPASNLELMKLFGSHVKGEIELTPLQNEAASLQLIAGPQLFILEDVTGAGKTEAAMILLYRLMVSGLASGFYFGLPTMATANAMYRRMADVYRALYSDEVNPSLVLAHSASSLNERYRKSFNAYCNIETAIYGDGSESASAHCSQWLTDNRKKALLSEAGVGTIDQALLAVLPSKHQSLRLFGLLGKVLIVDEVHACDAYMHTLLGGLLKAHASAGGSAILLSATLSQNQRQQLIDEFTSGLKVPGKVIEKNALNDYPLITQAGNQQLNELRVATRDSVKREVKVQMLDSEQKLIKEIADALEQGQCVCWIRNTVGDARQALQTFKDAYGQYKTHLFHARYAMGDRINIENDVLELFGPDSHSGTRQGRLLIATQVVEQSLDLDFDLLASDLAPVDLIIQRAGRLRRHLRDVYGNRIKGVDQRGLATLIIYSPPWQDAPDADWLTSTLPGTAAVYKYQDAQLWLGLKLLRKKKAFNMPEDARALIEGVYGDDAEIPDGLSHASLEQYAVRLAESGQGQMNLLKIELGYQQEQNIWWDEASTPTRLGEESTTVYLARWQHGKLMPWIEQGETVRRWANSGLSVRKKLVSESVRPEGVSESDMNMALEQLPGQGKFGVLLVLMPGTDGVWRGCVVNQEGEEIVWVYLPELGLMAVDEMVQLCAPL